MSLLRIFLILWVLAGVAVAGSAAGLGAYILTSSETAGWVASLGYVFSLLFAFQMVGDGRDQPLRLQEDE